MLKMIEETNGAVRDNRIYQKPGFYSTTEHRWISCAVLNFSWKSPVGTFSFRMGRAVLLDIGKLQWSQCYVNSLFPYPLGSVYTATDHFLIPTTCESQVVRISLSSILLLAIRSKTGTVRCILWFFKQKDQKWSRLHAVSTFRLRFHYHGWLLDSFQKWSV